MTGVFNATWLYDETLAATLIDPTAPVEIEYRPASTPAVRPWFVVRTDPSATQLMPAVKPKGTQ